MGMRMMQRMINRERENKFDNDSIDPECYAEKLIEHQNEVCDRMNEMRSINMNTLNLKMGINDIMNDENRSHHQLFLDKFIQTMSRIFFDAKIILQIKFDQNTETNHTENKYVSDQLMSILDTIPLAKVVIKTSGLLSKSQNYDIHISDLKEHMDNIEKFRLL